MEARNPEALFIGDPDDHKFDEAIIGIGSRCGQPDLLVYSYEKTIDVLVKVGMDRDEAIEYVDTNIVGAWHGEHTPIIMD